MLGADPGYLHLRLAEIGLVSGADGDAGPLFGQGQGGGPSHALAGAANDGNSVSKAQIHVPLPPRAGGSVYHNLPRGPRQDTSLDDFLVPEPAHVFVGVAQLGEYLP